MTATIAALCAAIDAGDDAALPILADALEEAGDPRAAGLRRRLSTGRLLDESGDWYACWSAVPGTGPNYRRSRSRAYLALALALSPDLTPPPCPADGTIRR